MNRLLKNLVIGSVFLAVPLASSAEEPGRSITTVRVSPGQIVFEPQNGNGWVTVRVTGPGEYAFIAEYPPGQLPIFRALDPDGNPLPDGSYNYEIDQWPGKGKTRAKDDPQGAPQKSKGEPKLFETQFGTFTVLNGSIVDPTLEETSSKSGSSNVSTNAAVPDSGVTTRDQVIPDDLIVQGSVCVGFDCVNNESFGFDTLRLKENNTRIKFEDTSSTTGFPSTDWQLTANDSASGGANKFSIEDITSAQVPFTIEGSAPSNSLYVDSSKRVGFGTSTPVLDLHATSGNTPAIRLEQNGTSGFTPQTWDIAGNEANFFIRDVTGGSKLPFRIRPGAPTSSIDIAASGNVGISTTSPSARLHVDAVEANDGILISSDGQPELRLEKDDQPSSDGNWKFFVNGIGNLLIRHNDTDTTSPVKIYGEAIENLLVIGASTSGINNTSDPDRVTINGELWVSGSQVPDYVFEPAYELESIEEHARLMWQNKHLPAMRGTITHDDSSSTVNLAEHQYGILEELEKAHIYIEQLHTRLRQLEERLAEIEQVESLPAN